MEIWQMDLLLLGFEVDFFRDIEQIKSIITDLVKPFEGYEDIKIKVDEDLKTYRVKICIGKETYIISVNSREIMVAHETRGESQIPSARYSVEFNRKKNRYEHACLLGHVYDLPAAYKPLESTIFDYRAIINKLMNYIVSDIKE